MTFTQKVLTGLIAGVLCGLFLGERATPLQVLAAGFVKLLQMTVLPYVVLSIIGSLGALSYSEARRLGLRVGLVILALWAVALTFVFVIPLTFPALETGSFFSTRLLEPRSPFNFVDLYIPANPFHSLANNIVPAIVLFSVILGIALIGVPDKQKLLEVLRVGMETVSRATRFVVKLTPYGIFAIAAHSAGTLSPEQLGRLEIFLVAYTAIVLLLALWVLPALVSTLTPIPFKEVLWPNKDALVTAFVAGDMFIVLPSLMESCEQTLCRRRIGQHDEHKLPEVIVPASFNFPHTGKLLSLSFILFAGWFADAAVSWRDYPQLASAGVLSSFGSLNSAIPFLLDLFRIPADTFQLFLGTGVINARFGSLLATVHLVVVALLGAAAMAGAVRFQPARLARFAVMTLLLSAGTVAVLRFLFSHALEPHFDGAEIVAHMKPLYPSTQGEVIPEGAPVPPPPASRGVYEAILSRGFLRVCYFGNRPPLLYRSPQGQLVGYEAEAAHLLARELGVNLQFIEITPGELTVALEDGPCDIIMSGVALTPRRQAQALFSISYLDETAAFVVLDHRRDEFMSWTEIRAAPSLRIAVQDLPHYTQLVRDLLPKATVVPINLEGLVLDERADLDAYFLPAEIGSVLTLLRPKFTVVVPAPKAIRIPVGYPIAKRDERFAHVVNAWIEVRQKDGTFDRLYQHWILGQSGQSRARRWSILDNVLHWGN